MHSSRLIFLSALVFAAYGCDETPATLEEIRITGNELVYTVAHTDGTFVGGLTGSVDPFANVLVKSREETVLGEFLADENGRFHEPVLSAAGDIITLQINQAEPVEFRVRDFEQAHAEAVWPPLEGIGSVPNDLLVIDKAENTYGVVVRSGDNAVSKIDLKLGLKGGVLLPDREGFNGFNTPANPWFAKHYRNDQIFVTGAGQDLVYLLDLNTETLVRVIEASTPVVLEQDYKLSRPIDVDGDGIIETKIRQFLPKYPQGLFVTSTHLLVAYSGFVSPRLDAARPAVYLPSVVAAWPLTDLARSPDYLVLPHLNAQEISLASDGDLLVTCSGVIEMINGKIQTSSDSAVIKIDSTNLEVTQVYELADFAASSSVDVDGYIWTSSILRAEIKNLQTQQVVSLNQEPIDSIFRLQVLPGKILAVSSFNTDRVHLVDAYTGQLNPPPFFKPFSVGPGKPIFDGAQILARRPGRAGVDFVGPDLFCLSGVASRIWPIETRKLLGP